MDGYFAVENVLDMIGGSPFVCGKQYPVNALHKVGVGGFGCVYRMREQRGWPRGVGTLALKRSNVGFPVENLKLTFREDGRSARAMLRRAFAAEWVEYGRADGADGHVPRPYAFGLLVDVPGEIAYYAILMDWMDGIGLEDAAAQVSEDGSGALSASQTIRLGVRICEALQSLHRKNVVHRDLYPANIKVRLSSDNKVFERVYLLDLGQSACPADIVTPNGSSQRLAQLRYGAPEMFVAPGDAFYNERNDQTVDAWSLGALLYHLRTGADPHPLLSQFDGRSYLTPEDARAIAKIKSQSIELEDAYNDPGDKVLREAIRSCTQADPAFRPYIKRVQRSLERALTLVNGSWNVISGEIPTPQRADASSKHTPRERENEQEEVHAPRDTPKETSDEPQGEGHSPDSPRRLKRPQITPPPLLKPRMPEADEGSRADKPADRNGRERPVKPDLESPRPLDGKSPAVAADVGSDMLTPPSVARLEQEVAKQLKPQRRYERQPDVPDFLDEAQAKEYVAALESSGPERAMKAAQYYAVRPVANAKQVALAFRKIAADRGDSAACILYGHALFYGLDGVHASPAAAFGYLQQGTRSLGLPKNLWMVGAFDLGLAHRYGLGTPRDFKKAYHLFESLAKYGRADAMYELAVLLDEGSGVRRDQKRARQLMERARSLGYGPAALWLKQHH